VEEDLQTFDLRTTVHVITAFEAAFLDLLGKYLGVPRSSITQVMVNNVMSLKY
jgi:L-alanine-DL-glutamate epimerase-like enolase superfamily enzyme